MTEYWLQKKTIGGWSVVTWYDNQEQAEKNYNECIKAKGYAWRLVKVETLHLQPLEDMIEVNQPQVEPFQDKPKVIGWADGPSKAPNQMANNPWGSTVPSVKPEHGLSGSVWVINHTLRVKARIAGNQLEKYLAEGYVRGGPKTSFEG